MELIYLCQLLQWTCRVFFGLVQLAAFFLAFKGFEDLARKDRPVTFRDLSTNPILNIMLSLSANLGFYIIASIICVRSLLLLTTGVDGLLMTTICYLRWLAGPLAYGNFVPAVRNLVAFVYQCLECLRCKPPIYSFINIPLTSPCPPPSSSQMSTTSHGGLKVTIPFPKTLAPLPLVQRAKKGKWR